MMQAKRLLRKGCAGFLSYIVDTQQVKLELNQMLVVKKFADVFSNELLGLPSDWEVEFVTDVVTGIDPISKAPYRMALVAIKELMAQLQELLD